MYISEAIDQADKLKPNAYMQEEKVRWLSDIDGRIFEEIISKHKGSSEGQALFTGYDGTTDIHNTKLLVPYPYTELYIHYLKMQMDLNNEETVKYNNDKALFNVEYLAFMDYWNRTHMPDSPDYAECFKI